MTTRGLRPGAVDRVVLDVNPFASELASACSFGAVGFMYVRVPWTV